ncbi:AMP deaminase 3-like, partial [Hypanus sabinus]
MKEALSLDSIPEDLPHVLSLQDGVFTLADPSGSPLPFICPTSHTEYSRDMKNLLEIIADGPLRTYCNQRLKMLVSRFHLHQLANEKKEFIDLQEASHSDFYNVAKVDTHIHAAACMNQHSLLRFIHHTYAIDRDREVHQSQGQTFTLGQLFQRLDLDPDHLDIDALNVHADRETFQRFDRFNAKYNPVGASELRRLYLKTNNHINGEYFAGLIKEYADSMDDASNQFAELRISIYGNSPDEWNQLAAWFFDQRVCSPKIRWMVQVPRI